MAEEKKNFLKQIESISSNGRFEIHYNKKKGTWLIITLIISFGEINEVEHKDFYTAVERSYNICKKQYKFMKERNKNGKKKSKKYR